MGLSPQKYLEATKKKLFLRLADGLPVSIRPQEIFLKSNLKHLSAFNFGQKRMGAG
jgi:hypothetical protein